MNRQQRMVCTPYYKYINLNPKNKYVGDCVIRAIANACNQSWEDTVKEMTELGIKHGLVLNDKKLYPMYLKNKGFKEMKEPRDFNNQKLTVKNWLCTRDYYLYHTYAIVANVGSHHITCIKEGKIENIWNCSSQTIHKWWVK